MELKYGLKQSWDLEKNKSKTERSPAGWSFRQASVLPLNSSFLRGGGTLTFTHKASSWLEKASDVRRNNLIYNTFIRAVLSHISENLGKNIWTDDCTNILAVEFIQCHKQFDHILHEEWSFNTSEQKKRHEDQVNESVVTQVLLFPITTRGICLIPGFWFEPGIDSHILVDGRKGIRRDMSRHLCELCGGRQNQQKYDSLRKERAVSVMHGDK